MRSCLLVLKGKADGAAAQIGCTANAEAGFVLSVLPFVGALGFNVYELSAVKKPPSAVAAPRPLRFPPGATGWGAQGVAAPSHARGDRRAVVPGVNDEVHIRS